MECCLFSQALIGGKRLASSNRSKTYLSQCTLVQLGDLLHPNGSALVADLRSIQAPDRQLAAHVLLRDAEKHQPPVRNDGVDCAPLLPHPPLPHIHQHVIQTLGPTLVLIDHLTGVAKDPRLSTVDHAGQRAIVVSWQLPPLYTVVDSQRGTVVQKRRLKAISGEPCCIKAMLIFSMHCCRTSSSSLAVRLKTLFRRFLLSTGANEQKLLRESQVVLRHLITAWSSLLSSLSLAIRAEASFCCL